MEKPEIEKLNEIITQIPTLQKCMSKFISLLIRILWRMGEHTHTHTDVFICMWERRGHIKSLELLKCLTDIRIVSCLVVLVVVWGLNLIMEIGGFSNNNTFLETSWWMQYAAAVATATTTTSEQ